MHKKCLEDRNVTLISEYGDNYLDKIPEVVKVLIDTEKGSAVISSMELGRNITLPNCNLEEELDNVCITLMGLLT